MVGNCEEILKKGRRTKRSHYGVHSPAAAQYPSRHSRNQIASSLCVPDSPHLVSLIVHFNRRDDDGDGDVCVRRSHRHRHRLHSHRRGIAGSYLHRQHKGLHTRLSEIHVSSHSLFFSRPFSFRVFSLAHDHHMRPLQRQSMSPEDCVQLRGQQTHLLPLRSALHRDLCWWNGVVPSHDAIHANAGSHRHHHSLDCDRGRDSGDGRGKWLDRYHGVETDTQHYCPVEAHMRHIQLRRVCGRRRVPDMALLAFVKENRDKIHPVVVGRFHTDSGADQLSLPLQVRGDNMPAEVADCIPEIDLRILLGLDDANVVGTAAEMGLRSIDWSRVGEGIGLEAGFDRSNRLPFRGVD